MGGSLSPTGPSAAARAPGCPMQGARDRLRASRLRPTRQRLMLAWILFGADDRHVSAEQLHAEARRARVQVSLATIYNTLHSFAERGLLREISGIAGRIWFDTNTRDHQHFVHEETGELFDVEGGVSFGSLPEPPTGYEITRLDVMVRLRRAHDCLLLQPTFRQRRQRLPDGRGSPEKRG